MITIDNAVINGVYANENEIGVAIGWVGDDGFGEIIINMFQSNKKIIIDSEYMSKEFVKAVLNQLVDSAMLAQGEA